MNELRGFMLKEWHHIFRDKRTLSILLLLPLAQVLLFGFAVRTDIQEIKLAAVDPAPDGASQSLQAQFRGTRVYRFVGVVPTVDRLDLLFQRGDIDQALVFPRDFAARLRSDPDVALQVITDTTDPNTGSQLQGHANAVINAWSGERRAGPGTLRIVPRVRMRFNPTVESVNLFVPGLMAVLLTVVSALMSAISLSREKERGTLEVLLVSPLRPWQIIYGKVLPYMILGFLNVLSVLLAARLVFGVPLRGSVALLLGESLLFLVVSLALGVLIAAATSSQRTAMVGSLMGLMIPTLMLSGMIFPISSMPNWLQPVSNIVPGKWFLVIARGIMLKGVGLEVLWQETLILFAMAAVLLTAATRTFNVRLG